MPSVAFRTANLSREAEAVAELHRRCAEAAYQGLFAEPFSLEEAVEHWRGFRGELELAEVDGEVVGFVARRGETLESLYLLPEHWNEGIGAALLARASRTRRLWVLEANLRARGFYEHHGWRADGTTKPGPEGLTELGYRREPPH